MGIFFLYIILAFSLLISAPLTFNSSKCREFAISKKFTALCSSDLGSRPPTDKWVQWGLARPALPSGKSDHKDTRIQQKEHILGFLTKILYFTIDFVHC